MSGWRHVYPLPLLSDGAADGALARGDLWAVVAQRRLLYDTTAVTQQTPLSERGRGIDILVGARLTSPPCLDQDSWRVVVEALRQCTR